MKIKLLHIDDLKEAEKEIKMIGSHPGGVSRMAPKAVFRAVKLFDLKPSFANIIKQGMLSIGGDASISKGCVECSVESTDVLMIGTIKHFKLLRQNMQSQNLSLIELSEKVWEVVYNSSKSLEITWKCRSKTFDLTRKTLIMGILNLTPDSFSDGGLYYNDLDKVLFRAEEMIKDGADIIDIGGESSRPGAEPVDAEEELNRILPALEKIKLNLGATVSIDTYKSYVAEECLRKDADIINDISALQFSSDMAGVVKAHDAGVVLMHMQKNPKEMQNNPQYLDVIADIGEFLCERIKFCEQAKIDLDRIAIDPGIGFGKTAENNLQIIKNLKSFSYIRCPILVGPSRKSFIGEILNLPVNERDEGTAASVCASIMNGAKIIRVHDVKTASRIAKMTDAIINS